MVIDKIVSYWNFPFWSVKAHLISNSLSYFPILFTKKIVYETPSPTKILKIGPAKHPVAAISPKPLDAIATVALKSPHVFPQANKDKPSKAYGKFKISPITYSKSITISDKKLIHIIAITNAKPENKSISPFGGTVFFVLHNTSKEHTNPGKSSPPQISRAKSI